MPFEFTRSSESHFSKNLLLFSDALEGVNLRLTLGVALDKQTNVTDLRQEDLRPYITDYITFPP